MRVGSARVAASGHALAEAHPRVVPAVARVAAGHRHPPGVAFAAGAPPAMRRTCVARRTPGMGKAPGAAFETTPGASLKKGVAYDRASNHRTLIKPHGRRSLSSKRVQSCPTVSKVVRHVAKLKVRGRAEALGPRSVVSWPDGLPAGARLDSHRGQGLMLKPVPVQHLTVPAPALVVWPYVPHDRTRAGAPRGHPGVACFVFRASFGCARNPLSSRDALQLLVGELAAVLPDESQPLLGGLSPLGLLDHLRRHVLQPHGTLLSLRRTVPSVYAYSASSPMSGTMVFSPLLRRVALQIPTERLLYGAR